MEKLGNDKGGLITGIGSALVDILANETDAFLEKTGAAKGGMTLVDNAFIEKAVGDLTGKPHIVPGGAACNTIIGIGRLGGTARFVGMRGDDEFGGLFEKDLVKNNVSPELLSSPSPTGRVLSIITPDAQRSMFTYLGASSEMDPAVISEHSFRDSSIVLVEGYMLFNKDLIMAALTSAKAAGAVIALDLSSFTVVEESKAFLTSSVMEFVDIVFANEDEGEAYVGSKDEKEIALKLAEKAEIAVLKLGKRGSRIVKSGEITEVSPVGSGDAVDTTGAGDLYAAGFLYGLVNGFPLEKCGRIASACGFEVCQVIGADIPGEGWERIRSLI